MNAAKRIRRFVEGQLVDPNRQAERDPLSEGLLDSLAIEQLIGYIEDTFDIWLDDDDVVAENFASIDAVAALVEAKRKAG